MNIDRCFIHILLVLLILSSCEQKIFIAHYGENAINERVASIDSADEDDYYILGSAQGSGKLFVTRCDNNGDINWTRSYNIGPNAVPSDVNTTADDGCIIVGSGLIQVFNSFVARLDNSGQEMWKRQFKPYGTSTDLTLKNVIELDEGSFAITGTLTSPSGFTAPIIIKIDENGNNPRYWRYNGPDFYGAEIKQHPSSSEIILLAEHEYEERSILVSVNPITGATNWSSYFNNVSGLGLSVSNDYIYVSGHIGSPIDSDPFLIKTDINGNIQWAKRYTISGIQDHCNLLLTESNGLVISGTNSTGMFLLSTDETGSMRWYREYLGNYDLLNTNYNTGHGSLSAISFSDGGFGLAAHDYSLSASFGMATFIRTNENGNAPCEEIGGIPSIIPLVVDQEFDGPTLETISIDMTVPTDVLSSENFLSNTECSQSNCTPPPSSLVSWFPLGANGSDYDLVNGNVAVSASGSISTATGKVGFGYSFNGSSDYLSVPSSSSYNLGVDDFSIGFWLNLGNNVPVRQTVACKVDGAGYCLSLESNFIELMLNDGMNSGIYISSGTIPVDNEWHYVMVTVDRSSTSGVKYYVDGVQQSTSQDPTSVVNSVSNNGVFYIGRHPIQGDLFASQLDELEIYQEALDELAVKRIYAVGSSGKCTNTAYVPKNIGYCSGQTTLNVGVTICNYGNSDRTYTLQELVGSPIGSSNGYCNSGGPVNFTDITNSITVSSSNCGLYFIEIEKPVNLNTQFNRACYQTTFQDDLGNRFWSDGAVLDLSSFCSTLQNDSGEIKSAIVLTQKSSGTYRVSLQNDSDQEVKAKIHLSESQPGNYLLESINLKVKLDQLLIPPRESVVIPLKITSQKRHLFQSQSLLIEAYEEKEKYYTQIGEIPIILSK